MIIELLGFLFGVISVYYSTKQNKISWILGFFSSICLFYLFYLNQIYGQMLLQFVSIIQCIYGWITWNKLNDKITTRAHPIFLYSIILLLFIFSKIFTDLTNPDWSNELLYFDRLGSMIAIFATFLLINKIIESWWLFMINNLMVIGLSIHYEFYFVMILNVVLFILSIKGYKEWKLNLKQNEI